MMNARVGAVGDLLVHMKIEVMEVGICRRQVATTGVGWHHSHALHKLLWQTGHRTTPSNPGPAEAPQATRAAQPSPHARRPSRLPTTHHNDDDQLKHKLAGVVPHEGRILCSDGRPKQQGYEQRKVGDGDPAGERAGHTVSARMPWPFLTLCGFPPLHFPLLATAPNRQQPTAALSTLPMIPCRLFTPYPPVHCRVEPAQGRGRVGEGGRHHGGEEGPEALPAPACGAPSFCSDLGCFDALSKAEGCCLCACWRGAPPPPPRPAATCHRAVRSCGSWAKYFQWKSRAANSKQGPLLHISALCLNVERAAHQPDLLGQGPHPPIPPASPK